jgi:hypothetical protein
LEEGDHPEEDRNNNRSWLYELRAAAIGAVLVSIVQALFIVQTKASFDPVSLIWAFGIGALIGWGYRLANGLQQASTQAQTQLEISITSRAGAVRTTIKSSTGSATGGNPLPGVSR